MSILPLGVPSSLSGFQGQIQIAFQFTNLPPGIYELTFSLPGFTTAAARVTAGPGKTERLTIRMSVGTLSETVAVTGVSPRVEVSTSAVGAQWPAGAWRYRGPLNRESYDSFDEKIQVEFNPRRVAAYRLIGYEDRVLTDQDFLDDKKDAGEIGAGHTVTALYDIVPAGADFDVPSIGPLRYQREAQLTSAASSDELMTVKPRFKSPREQQSRPIDAVTISRVRSMGANMGFASAIAEFGMLLRQSKYVGDGSFASAAARARKFLGKDADGDRAELVTLIERAAGLRRAESTGGGTNR